MLTTIPKALGSRLPRGSKRSVFKRRRRFQREALKGSLRIPGLVWGVWLMPDNRNAGALEAFLRDLIDQPDPLLCLAERSAKKVKQLGARYSDHDAQKAVLHTWLAWQKDPGRPYGVAIKARFFGVHSAATDRFVTWFQRVFGVTAQL